MFVIFAIISEGRGAAEEVINSLIETIDGIMKCTLFLLPSLTGEKSLKKGYETCTFCAYIIFSTSGFRFRSLQRFYIVNNTCNPLAYSLNCEQKVIY